MLDAASLTAIIMAALSIVGVTLQQTKHCKSGCCEISKEAEIKNTKEIESELVIKNDQINKNRRKSNSE